MDKLNPDSLQALKELQSIDAEIALLEQQKETLPPEMVGLRKKMQEIEAAVSALAGEAKALAGERRENEAALEDRTAALEKLRSQKSMVSSNEAYSALLKEIEGAEREKARVEEDIIVYMERSEEIAGLEEEKKADLGACRARMSELEGKNRIRTEEIDGKLARLRVARGEKAGRVEAGILDRYERAREVRGALALVSAREGLCRGCFMGLRPQVINELMKGELAACEGCSRLMYWEEEKVECGPVKD